MRQAGRIPPDQSEIAFPDAIAQSTVFTRLHYLVKSACRETVKGQEVEHSKRASGAVIGRTGHSPRLLSKIGIYKNERLSTLGNFSSKSRRSFECKKLPDPANGFFHTYPAMTKSR